MYNTGQHIAVNLGTDSRKSGYAKGKIAVNLGTDSRKSGYGSHPQNSPQTRINKGFSALSEKCRI